jgi:secreted Zn-dependent insulinase-like peptidase
MGHAPQCKFYRFSFEYLPLGTKHILRVEYQQYRISVDKRLSNESRMPYFCPCTSGITVTGGYNEKLPALCDVILRRMVNFEVKDDRFEIYREQYARSYQNFEKEQPYQHAMYHQV